MAVQNDTASVNGLAEFTGCMQAQRSGTTETHRVEDADSAGMALDGRLRIQDVSTHERSADFMTKAMSQDRLRKFWRALNLRGCTFADLGQHATTT